MKYNLIALLLIFYSYTFADNKGEAKINTEFDIALKVLNAKKFKEAEILFLKLAEKKEPRSEFIYAWMLIRKNSKKAMFYFNASHKQGCLGASGVLASIDMNKNSLTSKARSNYIPTLLYKTALQGDINSQFLYATHLMYIDKYIESYAWFSVIKKLDIKGYSQLIKAAKKMQKHLSNLVSESEFLLAKKKAQILIKKYMKRDLRVCQQSRYLNKHGIKIIEEYLTKMH